jgi:hypothetical protein
MKRKWILTFGAGLVIGAVSLAATQGLVRLEPRSVPAPVQDPDLQAWVRELTRPDLDLREQAYERALATAARKPALRSVLQAWARGEEGPELAWTARLLLRELGRTSALHGLAVPRLRAGRPTAMDMEELWRQMAEMHGSLEDLFERDSPLGPPRLPEDLRQGSQTSQAFQLRVGPDGVECEVTTEEDGRSVTRRYQAASLEQLLEQHPELGEHIEGRGLGAGSDRPAPDRSLGSRGGVSRDSQVLRTDILGVVVTAVSAERAAALGLPVGQGLAVERVEPGTLADALGVQRGHVLVELDGRALRTSEDISAQMAQRAPDGDLRLVLLDRFGQERTRVWKPQPPAAEAQDGEPGAPDRDG